jgi:hypothetical protein
MVDVPLNRSPAPVFWEWFAVKQQKKDVGCQSNKCDLPLHVRDKGDNCKDQYGNQTVFHGLAHLKPGRCSFHSNRFKVLKTSFHRITSGL